MNDHGSVAVRTVEVRRAADRERLFTRLIVRVWYVIVGGIRRAEPLMERIVDDR